MGPDNGQIARCNYSALRGINWHLKGAAPSQGHRNLDWHPIGTAPRNVRILVSTGHRVFIARAGSLRWFDDADHLIDRPAWWMPLPALPSEPQPARKPQRRTRA